VSFENPHGETGGVNPGIAILVLLEGAPIQLLMVEGEGLVRLVCTLAPDPTPGWVQTHCLEMQCHELIDAF